MSLINSKNKMSDIDLQNTIQKIDISKIPIIDIQTVMNHNQKIGKSYTLIEETCITQEPKYKISKIIRFDNLTEKMIPFIKFIPKLRSLTTLMDQPYPSHTFITNWLKIDDSYVLLVGIFARQVDDNDKDVQLYVSLDIVIKSTQYAQQIYSGQ